MIRWRKAGKSAGSGACVEIGHTLAVVRDSKNQGGPMLVGAVPALVSAVKRGAFG